MAEWSPGLFFIFLAVVASQQDFEFLKATTQSDKMVMVRLPEIKRLPQKGSRLHQGKCSHIFRDERLLLKLIMSCRIRNFPQLRT